MIYVQLYTLNHYGSWLNFFLRPFVLEGAGSGNISNILSEKRGPPQTMSDEDRVIMSNASNLTSLYFPPLHPPSPPK